MPLSPRAAEAHTGPALRNAPGDAALSRHTPAGTLQVAAYDSSYNQHQYGLYNQRNSWVVVRTI